MLRAYLDRAMHRARYTMLEDGTFAAEVDGLAGVLAVGPTLEACRDQLEEVVEEWVLVRIARGLDVPSLDGVTVSVSRVA